MIHEFMQGSSRSNTAAEVTAAGSIMSSIFRIPIAPKQLDVCFMANRPRGLKSLAFTMIDVRGQRNRNI